MTMSRLVLASTAAIALLAAATACDPRATSTEKHSYEVSDTLTKLIVDDNAGKVEIVTGDGPVSVEETYRFSDRAPKTAHTITDGILRLTDDSCGNAHFAHCEVGYRIRVPAALAVDIHADAGAVEVTGLSGDLTVRADAGKVEATALSSQHATVQSDAGAVTLSFATAPTTVDARSDAGKVSVTVPGGQSYRVDADTDAGSRTVKVPVDSNATRKITAHSDAGAVEVLTG